MSGMLARLAALRAKRAAAGGPAARRVDPALAAAAAAAGAPTRGTWDADYALRLREGAGGGGDAGNESGSDEDVVVLPPPAVKLDPAAQREKWRRDMRTQAKVRRGAEEASGVAFGFERCREEREEEEEEEEVVEVEIQGEIEDEDVMLATVVDPDVGSDAESTAEAEADGDACADADAEATGDAGADAEEAEGSKVDNADRQDHAQHQSQSLAPTKCVHADKGRAAAEEEVQAESSPAKAPAATAPRPRLDPLPRKTPLSTRPHFVDDQAEDEDGNARDRDSDRDSDRDGEQTAGDPLSPDDVDEAACDPAAAAFHWQWEEREEATKLAAIVSGAGRGRDARRPRNDDNAMDLTDMVASGAVRAGSVGVDGGDCASTVGDHGGDGNEDGEMLDLAKTSTETYVDNMFRMRQEESLFGNGENGEHSDDAATTSATVEERRTKATALWKARHRRATSSAALLDPGDLSRCGFLEDTTDDKRDEYRAQIERACGISTSRDGFESREAPDPGASSGPPVTLPGLRSASRQLALGAGACRSKFPPLQVPRRGTSRGGVLDPNSVPEWERRKLCLERKEAHRRTGTSIGMWAFAAERNLGVSRADRSIAHSKGAPAPSAGGGSGASFSKRRKRSHGPTPTASLPEAGVESGGGGTNRRASKKPKRSRQGLLDILGSRPSSGPP